MILETGIIPAGADTYHRKLRGQTRYVCSFSSLRQPNREFTSTQVSIIQNLIESGLLRVEGGFHAIPSHVEHAVKTLQEIWLPQLLKLGCPDQDGHSKTKENLIRIGILGMADVQEFLEKIHLIERVLGSELVRTYCYFFAIDRRQKVLQNVGAFRENSNYPPFLSVIAIDLLDDNHMDNMLTPEYCAAPLHLGIMHLTADFSSDPKGLVKSSFNLIAPGGILLGATKQQSILDEVAKYGEIIGDVCWAPDLLFDGQDTACFIAKKYS